MKNIFTYKKWHTLFLAMLFLCSQASAQNISGIVNTYTSVTAISANTVTVSSAAGYAVGDRVLLIQMQGATINTSQTIAFGDVTNYNNAGNYEFARITAVSANQITLSGICRGYTPGQGVQLIRVPVYTNPNII